MASLPRRMESGWVQLFGRWIDKDFYITVVSFSRWSHLVAASIFWPWQFCLDTGGFFLFHKIIVEAVQNRRKGVASLLLEQISVQSQLPITVEVQVMKPIWYLQKWDGFKFKSSPQTENSEALAFYHSLGFSLVETLENYYRFLLEHFVSISLHCIGAQEGELHRGAQAEACQMTCDASVILTTETVDNIC